MFPGMSANTRSSAVHIRRINLKVCTVYYTLSFSTHLSA
jgi:hypothetical protein